MVERLPSHAQPKSAVADTGWYYSKQRSEQPVSIPTPPTSPPSSKPDLADLLTEYVVDLGHGRSVSLRGLASDLKAITAGPWLTTKTHVQGYLEAAAKLTVYLVAAFSGNMTQAGNLIFMALLIVTAGLLGLSNAHARTLRMHGRIAAPTMDSLPYHQYGSSSQNPASPSSLTSPLGSGNGGQKSPAKLGESVDGSPYPDSASTWGFGSATWPPTTTTQTSTGLSSMVDHHRA